MLTKKLKKKALPLMGTKTQWLSEKSRFWWCQRLSPFESLESWNSRSVRKQGARRLAVT